MTTSDWLASESLDDFGTTYAVTIKTGKRHLPSDQISTRRTLERTRLG